MKSIVTFNDLQQILSGIDLTEGPEAPMLVAFYRRVIQDGDD
ncbi:MAG: hypothetical protein AAGB12_04950 [Pseudomonadota bacterium]